MDNESILVTYAFASKKATLNWKDISYGIEKKYIRPDAAIEHAISELSDVEEFPQQLLDLASLHKSESELAYPFVNELANHVSEQNYEITSAKWLYLLLAWVYEHKDRYSEPLSVVESLYADFNYPDKIANFVRYMPSDEPDLGSLELNEARLYWKWKTYLYSQEERFSNEIREYFNK